MTMMHPAGSAERQGQAERLEPGPPDLAVQQQGLRRRKTDRNL